MEKSWIILAVVALTLAISGCEKESAPSAEAQSPEAANEHAEKPAGDGHGEHGDSKPSDEHEGKGHDAHTEHGGDSDLALKPLMEQLGKDMAEVSEALWLEDYPKVSKAAMAIADHPHVGATEKKRIVGILGAEMGKFAQADKVVHDAAAGLSKAADAKDNPAILKELAELQTGCVACHTGFRARLKP